MMETLEREASVVSPSAQDGYKALESHCQRMLQAARDDNWDEVQRLGIESQALITRLREARSEPMDKQARREKFEMLRKIVQIDAQIRHLSQPWTARLDKMMGVPSAG